MPAISQPVKVEVSMLSLKWSDFFATVLPGAVAVFALAPWFTPAWELFLKINATQLSTGVAFLFCAAIAGGILDGVTRTTWERWLCSKKKPPRIYKEVTPERFPLFEYVVLNSYKYVTFYANLAWAIALLLGTYVLKSPNVRAGVIALLVVVIGSLLYSSWVQWGYYIGHATGFFLNKGSKDDLKSAARGNEGVLHEGHPDS